MTTIAIDMEPASSPISEGALSPNSRLASMALAVADVSTGLGYGHEHLPGFMNSYEAQIKKIGALLDGRASNSSVIVPVHKTRRGGIFTGTRTFFIQDRVGRQFLIMFRTEPFAADYGQHLAQKILDKAAVPSIWRFNDAEAEREGIYIYGLERVKGMSLELAVETKADTIKAMMKTLPSIARLLLKDGPPNDLPHDRKVAFDSYKQIHLLRGHVSAILSDHSPEVARWHRLLFEVSEQLDDLVALPLMAGHYDLSPKNIIVGLDWTANGFIGWNARRAGPMGSVRVYPFGMNLSFLHQFSGSIAEASDGTEYFVPAREFAEAERELWATI